MTPERLARLNATLSSRQPDLTVILDQVDKPFNLSAILRSCDAAGVLEAHAVYPKRIPRRTKKEFSAGVGKWVKVRQHNNIEDAISCLKDRNFKIYAAHPKNGARDFREADFVTPAAILLGAELDGISERGLELADEHLTIPMMGMAACLNVSVATALILYEVQRQRSEKGLYEKCRIEDDVYQTTLFEWAHPKVAEYCRRHGFEYPQLDQWGEVAERLPRTGDDCGVLKDIISGESRN